MIRLAPMRSSAADDSFDRWWITRESTTPPPGLIGPPAPETIGAAVSRYALEPNSHHFDYGGNLGIYLEPAFRGQGYGTIVFRKLLLECQEHGVGSIFVAFFDDGNALMANILHHYNVRPTLSGQVEGRDVLRYWLLLSENDLSDDAETSL